MSGLPVAESVPESSPGASMMESNKPPPLTRLSLSLGPLALALDRDRDRGSESSLGSVPTRC